MFNANTNAELVLTAITHYYICPNASNSQGEDIGTDTDVSISVDSNRQLDRTWQCKDYPIPMTSMDMVYFCVIEPRQGDETGEFRSINIPTAAAETGCTVTWKSLIPDHRYHVYTSQIHHDMMLGISLCSLFNETSSYLMQT